MEKRLIPLLVLVLLAAPVACSPEDPPDDTIEETVSEMTDDGVARTTAGSDDAPGDASTETIDDSVKGPPTESVDEDAGNAGELGTATETAGDATRTPEAPTVFLTIETEGQGAVTPSSGQHEHDVGTSVRVSAVPDAGWEFMEWQFELASTTGTVGTVDDTTGSEILITVDADLTLRAVFTTLSRWHPMGEPIIMVWDHIRGTEDQAGQFDEYPDMSGVNVISPTWFHLIDSQGTLSSYADAAYVDWAHSNGLAVWALVTNGFDPDRTQPVLRDPALRARVVDQLLAYAAMYKLDGINIDFENMYMADRDYFSQLVRELVPLAHEQGLVVSVDVTGISRSETWSRCYDRPALAQAADYLILMAYDQHPAASQVAGPVAGLDWTERSLRQVLEQVPSDRLILGIPFYTRLWQEQPQADGSVRVSSRALGMEEAWELVAQRGAETQLDPDAGAIHAWYQEDGSTYRIWIEDADTVRLRIELANEYGLPGVAAWRRGFEAPQIWQLIANTLISPPPVQHTP